MTWLKFKAMVVDGMGLPTFGGGKIKKILNGFMCYFLDHRNIEIDLYLRLFNAFKLHVYNSRYNLSNFSGVLGQFED